MKAVHADQRAIGGGRRGAEGRQRENIVLAANHVRIVHFEDHVGCCRATPDHQPTILQRQDEKYARRLRRPRTHMLNQPEASARFVGESYGFLLGSQQFSIVSIFA